jgi:hypothetical protein
LCLKWLSPVPISDLTRYLALKTAAICITANVLVNALMSKVVSDLKTLTLMSKVPVSQHAPCTRAANPVCQTTALWQGLSVTPSVSQVTTASKILITVGAKLPCLARSLSPTN